MTLCDRETGGRILCVRLSALGDVVHCMNALTLLRESRPSAKITWIVEDRTAGVIENHPYIDELISIPRLEWGQGLKTPWRWIEVFPEIISFISYLRKTPFDISIDFQSSLKSSWIIKAAKASARIGFSPPISREFNNIFQNRLVKAPSKNCHRIERYLALLAPADIATRYAEAFLPCSEEHWRIAGEVCGELGRPLIVFHPGTSDFAQFKRWLPENYGKLALKLITELGASVLVTFGPGEEALAHRVISASKHKARLAPRLSHIQQLTGILKKADLFVGSDTGPMHIAAALQTPVVALFGPKDPQCTGPFSPSASVITSPVKCRPCEKRDCSNPVCMQSIRIKDVHAAIKVILASQGKPNKVDSDIETLVKKPFYCHFELGNWKGKLHTAFSTPDFYRLLSMSGVKEDTIIDKYCNNNLQYEGNSVEEKVIEIGIDEQEDKTTKRLQMLIKRPLPEAKKNSKSDISYSLKQYFKTAALFYDYGMKSLIPIAWMHRRYPPGKVEIIIFDADSKADAALSPVRNNPTSKLLINAPDLLINIAGYIRKFHNKGFHMRDMVIEDIGFDDDYQPHIIALGKAIRRPLPPLIREFCWGRQLRRLHRQLERILPAEDISKYFIKPYCKQHISREPAQRLFIKALGLKNDQRPYFFWSKHEDSTNNK